MKASNQYLTLMFFVIDFQTFDQQIIMHPKLFQVPFRGGVGLCLRKTILNKIVFTNWRDVLSLIPLSLRFSYKHTTGSVSISGRI